MKTDRDLIRLEIDELILDGLDVKPADGETMRRALTDELRRQLAKSELANSMHNIDIPRLSASAIDLSAARSAAQLATVLAQRIAGQLSASGEGD